MGAKIEYTSYKFIKPPMLTEPEFVKWKADIERTPDLVMSLLEYSQWDVYKKEILAIIFFALVGLGVEFFQIKGKWTAIQSFAVFGAVIIAIRWFKSASSLDEAILTHNTYYSKLKQDIVSAHDYEHFKSLRYMSN